MIGEGSSAILKDSHRTRDGQNLLKNSSPYNKDLSIDTNFSQINLEEQYL
jgi:hypothetical protein